MQEVSGKMAVALGKEQSTKFNALPRAPKSGVLQLHTNVPRDAGSPAESAL
jgi:hypothetical protein